MSRVWVASIRTRNSSPSFRSKTGSRERRMNERVVRLALSMLRHALGRRTLSEALRLAAEFEGESVPTAGELVDHIDAAPAADQIRLVMHGQLAEWDGLPEAEW